MKHAFIPSKLKVRSIGFAIVAALCIVKVSHAQTNVAGHDSGSASWQSLPLAEQLLLSQGDSATDQSSSLSQNGESAARHDSPSPIAPSPTAASAEQKISGPCQVSSHEDESLLRKLIRMFCRPGASQGPNPDVDTNISAGGAGGG
jgi:hypothetical protein